MIGEVIQEYLVALGAKIDKPGFREMDQTIQQSGELITRATGSWAANFVKASTIIASAIAGVKAATLGLMTAAAKQDLEMEKYARSMMMSRDAAEQMKRATDALGESINDITLSPELSERFRELSADGGQMLVGGDFKETMRNFRDLIFQWTRLKQEASYAMTWIGYYLAKYLQKPLAEIRERFREFNDNFVKNISTWTEKAARAIVYILEIGRHFLAFLWDVGKALYNIWDSFPKGVKIATAALAGFWMIMRASPLGRMIALVSALMLLIDDYYAYMEGKNAALGPLWDKLNDAIERGKELWAEIVPVMEKISAWAEETAYAFMEWFEEISNDKDVKELIADFKDMWQAISDLGIEIFKFVRGALADLWEGFTKTDSAYSYRDALREVVKFVKELYKYIGWTTNNLKKFFDAMRRSTIMSQFWKTQGEEAKRFLDLLVRAVGAAGKLGQALLMLSRGDWEGAKKTAGEAWDIVRGKIDNRDARHGGGGGSFDNGSYSGGLIGQAAQGAARYGASIGRNVPLYKQWDDKWGDISFSQGTCSTSGCAPSSMAMVASWATGQEITPADVVNYANENNLVGAGGVQGGSFVPAIAEHYGFEMVQTDDIEEVRRSLEQGIPVVVAHDPGVFTDYGHFNVYTGFDENGRLRVNDPNGGGGFVEDDDTFDFNSLTQTDSADYYIIKNYRNQPQYVADSGADRPILEPVSQPQTSWRDSITAMQTAFVSSGVYQTPPYIGGASSSHTITMGDINVTIEGGANATAEDIGQKFQDVMYTFTSRTMIGQTI